jgi:hypothetical protein
LKCKVCDREIVEDDFCSIHLKAFKNLVERYDCWRKALEISWKEYLSEIKHNPLTGEWTKEVASYLIENEEKKNGEEI